MGQGLATFIYYLYLRAKCLQSRPSKGGPLPLNRQMRATAFQWSWSRYIQPRCLCFSFSLLFSLFLYLSLSLFPPRPSHSSTSSATNPQNLSQRLKLCFFRHSLSSRRPFPSQHLPFPSAPTPVLRILKRQTYSFPPSPQLVQV